MRRTLKRSLSIKLWLPESCNTVVILQGLTELAGGYTTWQACGVWLPSQHSAAVVENVRVVEALCTGVSHQQAVEAVQDWGVQFLMSNPKEQCFLARVGGWALELQRD